MSEDLKALDSENTVAEVSPVNWDEVPKMDLSGQMQGKIGQDEGINTLEEVGRPIVVYDDSDNDEARQNESEHGVAINNLSSENENNGNGEAGHDGMSACDEEDRQSSRQSSTGEVSDARNEMNELSDENVSSDGHNGPMNTDEEAGGFEDSISPAPFVERKTDPTDDIKVNGGVAEIENDSHDNHAESVLATDEASYSEETLCDPTNSEFDEKKIEVPNLTEELPNGSEEDGASDSQKVDLDLSDPEVERAATKIQAAFKGHQARKDIEKRTTVQASDKEENQMGELEESRNLEKHEFMSVKLRTRTWEQEKSYGNVDVLRNIASEVDGDEGDQARVKKLISWAKSSKKAKTETMKIREKKKIDSMRQAVDPNSLSMVIEEKGKVAGSLGVGGVSPSKGKKFEVRRVDSGSNFQVRKNSAILPQSEAVVTKDWIQSAVKLHEQEADVRVTDMSFKKANDMYHASITAQVAGKEKAYNWVIRVNPTEVDTNYNAKDKETFMVSELGKKIAEFVTRLKSQQVKMSVPFRPVIYADSRYAIFDDLKAYKTFRDDTGFDLEHMKIALKGLAKLHAMTYAYFNRGSDNLQNFAQTLKLMVNRHYQPSSAREDIDVKKNELALKFDYLLEVVRSTDAEGARLADAAAAKYGSGDFLYNIFKVL